MKHTDRLYGPETPNYAILNEAQKNQLPATKQRGKKTSTRKPASKPDATKPA